MSGQTQYIPGRRRGQLFLLLAGGAMLLAGSRTGAQAPAGPAKIYTSRSLLQLPVKIGPADRARLREVQLHVRAGAGPWVCQQTGTARQEFFNYQVPQDGEYAFAIVVVDTAGRKIPEDLSRQPPELVVVVDTKPPECVARLLTAPGNEILVHCEVHDANPDPAATRLESQNAIGLWQPVRPHPDYPGCFRLTGPHMLQGRLRVRLGDRAGNTATQAVNGLAQRMLSAAESAPFLAPPAQAAAAGPTANEPGPMPANLRSPPAAPPAAPEGPVITTANLTPAENPPRPKAVAAPSLPQLQAVNNKHVSLAYSLEGAGPRGVGRVEVWLTADKGETWHRVGEDPDRQSPVEIDLPGEGLYGLSIVVSNATGYGAIPPARGDTPDWWVVVDCTRPAAELVGVRPGGSKEELGSYVILWKAADQNLRPQPIDLFLASSRQGPWVALARGLPNTGSYRWVVPEQLNGEFYVRMEVTDQAGNVAAHELPQPVVVDLTRPRARVTGVSTAAELPVMPPVSLSRP